MKPVGLQLKKRREEIADARFGNFDCGRPVEKTNSQWTKITTPHPVTTRLSTRFLVWREALLSRKLRRLITSWPCDSILIRILVETKEKFQQLQKVISILGEEEKRALYDQTGCVDDDDLAGDVTQNLPEYFRAMYKEVTEADIKEFEANNRGSDSEKKDLIELYSKFKGNMNRLFCSMLCSDPKLGSHWFKDMLDEAITSVADTFSVYELFFHPHLSLI